ncbi:MAG TPA: CHAT domain-containing tetratricopeptide repeat protein [Candidatus Polarisedimenticolia bacterium]|nr:CHAT domain-containing tetratricopeptide repeat protein [Candidatus Polarisedimenticolia bacterium]
MDTTRQRCAAKTILGVLTLLIGACRAQPPSVKPTLSLIEEKVKRQEDFQGAARMARDVLRRLDASGQGDSLDAADAIDLLRRASWGVNQCGDPDALSLCRRAMAIREKHQRVDDMGYVWSLSNYANCLGPGGNDFRAAKPYYERAVAIAEKVLEPMDPSLGRRLSNLAAVDSELGEYGAARPLFERALTILEKNLGPKHHDVGVAHFNLGALVELLGDYEAARSHYEWILANQVNDPASTDTGGVLTRLGIVLNETGDPRGAEELYRRALRIYETNGGPEDKNVAWILGNLGRLKLESGDREGAYRLLERAAAIGRKEHAIGSAEAVPGMLFFADVLTDRGETQRAAAIFEEALSIQSTAFGPEGWHLAPGMVGYARLYYKTGRSAAALDYALRGESFARRQFQETARGLSEREALRYDRVRESGMDVALSVLAMSSSDRPVDAVERVWDALVRSRALVLDEMVGRRRNLLVTGVPGIEALFADLDAARNRLAKLAATAGEPADPAAHHKKVEEARQDEERMERAVGEKSAEFRQRIAARRFGLSEVVASMPRDSALVSYVLYGRPAATGGRRSPRSSYGAFVTVAGQAKPSFVRIGEAGTVDSLVERWRRIVSSPPPPAAMAETQDRDREMGNRLRQLLWDRLPGPVREARSVFLVPDGSIHLVNLAALPDGHGGRLLESGPSVHYLSAERDLSRPVRSRPPGGSFLVMGAPDFGDAVPSSACDQAKVHFPVLRGGGTHFSPLPASKDEAKQVADLLASRFRADHKAHEDNLLVGREATEEAFKRLAAGQRVIHLATHAFLTGESGANPLEDSGLAFAGANARRCDPGEAEDGLLMADEITSQDLSAAEWVVLSACDTGVGPIQAGEGVQGLRRAFELAGAGTLVMSLWSMEDQATRDWMKDLYEARLNGASWPEAVHQASLSLMAERRRAGLSTDPFYWGAFVAAGDWR